MLVGVFTFLSTSEDELLEQFMDVSEGRACVRFQCHGAFVEFSQDSGLSILLVLLINEGLLDADLDIQLVL